MPTIYTIQTDDALGAELAFPTKRHAEEYRRLFYDKPYPVISKLTINPAPLRVMLADVFNRQGYGKHETLAE